MQPGLCASDPSHSAFMLFSGELVQVESEPVGFAVEKKFFPGHFTALIPSHAAQHAAQSGVDTLSDLIVSGTRSNAGDERTLLVAVGEGQIV